MNPITRLIATVITGLILATLVAVGLLIGTGHAHAGTQAASSYAVEYAQRGGGHGGHPS